MVQRRHVQGYENFLEFTKDLKVTENPIFMLYTGTKLPDTTKSWCPDCVEAEPVLEQALEAADSSQEMQLVVVEVGDRAFWKDQNCPFRTNPITKLKVLPTLALWGTQKRLEGNQLLQADLIDMLLHEDGED
ncbi:Thioredoxin domain-containing protein [Ooceraea biroi]|uniref:Thioredoxin domain-containing protein 17 n=1 Tax=Ooceraea biroi TaxID=2015173 RepID=A0A026WLF5_OOCBI|nr:Thioredoxin domain-containing protein [Ooceraea biroi]